MNGNASRACSRGRVQVLRTRRGQWLDKPWSRLNFYFDWREGYGFAPVTDEEEQDGALALLTDDPSNVLTVA